MEGLQAGVGGRSAAEVEDADELKQKALADAPELAALLADLQGSLGEIRSRIGPLLKEVSPCMSSLWNSAAGSVLHVPAHLGFLLSAAAFHSRPNRANAHGTEVRVSERTE